MTERICIASKPALSPPLIATQATGIPDGTLVYQIETPLTTEFEKDGVNLSGGEMQKVAIARTLYRGQHLIIMDEPSIRSVGGI